MVYETHSEDIAKKSTDLISNISVTQKMSPTIQYTYYKVGTVGA